MCPSCERDLSYPGAPGHDDAACAASRRVTASAPMRVTITAAVVADVTRRTLVGTVYRYGEVGYTSAGPLAVAATMPPPPVGLPLTEEHDRDIVRGAVALVDNDHERLRIAVRVADGEVGDTALAEAQDRTRGAFSFDIEDAEVVDGVIVGGTWAAVGQVTNPAFNSARIDSIAASHHHTTAGVPMFTEEMRARLAELEAMTDRTPELDAELAALKALAELYPTAAAEPAPAPAPATAAAVIPVAAVVPAVPAGVPARVSASSSSTTTAPRGGELGRLYTSIVEALRPGGGGAQAITAALADVTHTAHTGNVEQAGWSGELWSGLVYEPQFSDLFSSSSLTNWRGDGWRFTATPAMQDYAGDKTAIPTGAVQTESDDWEAARMAVGVDIDRKFYDFPNEAFLAGLFERVRESWEIKLDDKVRAYTLAKAKAAAGVATQSSLLKAAAYGVQALKRRKVGTASWVYVNDDDLMSLFDITTDKLPALLDLWGINPRDFRSSQDIPEGTVLVGRREAADVKTLPGSPIRVSAQNLANGGVDEAFFGYWAIQEHHTSGIAVVNFDADFVAP